MEAECFVVPDFIIQGFFLLLLLILLLLFTVVKKANFVFHYCSTHARLEKQGKMCLKNVNTYWQNIRQNKIIPSVHWS